MATFTASWTTGQVLHTSSTVTNGSTATDAVDLDNLGYYEIDAQVEINIASGSPSGDVLIEAFGSADGGSNVDTVPLTQRRLNFVATGNQKISIPGLRGPHVSVKITNNTGVSLTYIGRYAGLQQASA
jgi:hypothetical protein